MNWTKQPLYVLVEEEFLGLLDERDNAKIMKVNW